MDGIKQAIAFNGTLVQGIQSGKLNRAEFTDLSSYEDETARLYDTFESSGDGIDSQEAAQLALRRMAVSGKFEAYSQGDFNPVLNDATDLDKGSNERASSIFDGVKDGSITQNEGVELLNLQRALSVGATKGDAVSFQMLAQRHKEMIQKARTGEFSHENDWYVKDDAEQERPSLGETVERARRFEESQRGKKVKQP